MNISSLNEPQRQAFLDLLVLAMYSDRHLAAAEDARLQRALLQMGLDSEYKRHLAIDGAVARVRRNAGSQPLAQAYAASLAKAFDTADLKREVYDALAELVASDSTVATEESNLMAAVRPVLLA